VYFFLAPKKISKVAKEKVTGTLRVNLLSTQIKKPLLKRLFLELGSKLK
jgi:hypothetical protein